MVSIREHGDPSDHHSFQIAAPRLRVSCDHACKCFEPFAKLKFYPHFGHLPPSLKTRP